MSTAAGIATASDPYNPAQEGQPGSQADQASAVERQAAVHVVSETQARGPVKPAPTKDSLDRWGSMADFGALKEAQSWKSARSL